MCSYNARLIYSQFLAKYAGVEGIEGIALRSESRTPVFNFFAVLSAHSCWMAERADMLNPC